jgi:hypothetical protein
MKQFPYGRLGNNLFEIAFIKSLSKRNNTQWALPLWDYLKYFQMSWNVDTDIKINDEIRELNFDFHPMFLQPIQNYFTLNTDIRGYWQSEKYFEDVWDEIKNEFKFKQGFLDSIFERTDFIPGKNDWAVHLRLGDYVGNKNYVQIQPSYYIEFFKDKTKTFYVFTDDYTLAKKMLGNHDNVEYVEGCSDIEHLALMSQFNNLIIANSTFSWWAAKIAEIYNKDVKVIRPECLFAGPLAKTCTGKDFYPGRWESRSIYQKSLYFKGKRDLKDVTFIIPVKNDSQDRVENLELTIKFIRANFNTNIIVGEQGTHDFSDVDSDEYIWFSYPNFHRTRMLNNITVLTQTPIVINWDADVFVNPDQIFEAVKMIREGYEVVYPYDGTFIHMDRCFYEQLNQDILLFNSFFGIFHNMSFNGKISYGGAVVFDKKAYLSIGGENENFISHAPEDVERFYRISTLGLKWGRTTGNLYHLDHFIGTDSTHGNEFKLINRSEINRVKSMDSNMLRKYIETWPNYPH